MIRRNNIEKKYLEEVSKYKIKCKCGHTMVLIKKKSEICTWCGRKVYRSAKDEFEDKMNKAIKTSH